MSAFGSFEEIDKTMEEFFEKTRERSPDELERISNDHLYLSSIWSTRQPAFDEKEMVRYVAHAPKCIDCMEHAAAEMRRRLMDKQDIAQYEYNIRHA